MSAAALRVRAAALLVLAAGLAAQAEHNQSLLAAPPRRPAAAWTTAVLARTGAAVVHVAVEVTSGRTTFALERPSSGVVVDAAGLVLTWWDLVREADGAADKRISVTVPGRAAPLRAAIVAHDDDCQLALLRLQVDGGAALPCAPLRTGPLEPGAPVLVCAEPGEGRVVSAGVATPALAAVPLRGHSIAAAELLLSDARIDERCHGAALFDAAGRLAGLCSSEHVHPPVAEPKLDDLRAKNFGVALRSARIGAFLQREFARLGVQPGAAAADAAAAGAAAAPPTDAAVAAVAPAVVGILAGADLPIDPGAEDPHAARRHAGVGSGVVITASGLVLTNHHLLDGEQRATVVLASGERLPAEVVQAHAATNLVLLQCTLPAGTTLVPARLAAGDAVPGEIVVAVGRPFGHALTASAGVLSALRDAGRLQVDANLGNQNAGGAIVDATGALLAIVDGGRRDAIELMFAMEGDRAKTETNLAFCTSVAAVQKAFADPLERLAPGALAPAAAPAGARPADPVARAVHNAGPAMLNLYVSRAEEPVGGDTANPFATREQVAMAGESLGSGVVIDGSGLAVTNWHVVDSATNEDGSMRPDHAVHARSFDGHTWPVRVLSISREDDLALVQLQLGAGETTTPVVLGDSGALALGEPVLAIGNPLGLANTVTAGVVVAKAQGIHVKGRWAKLEDLIETDAAINGGNSGGALLDLDGRLVGINSAGSSGFGNRGYAIPVDHVRRRVLGLLLSPEKMRSPFLGLTVADQSGGVVVTAVTPDGPAAHAQIAVGDRVLALAGEPVQWTPGFALRLCGLHASATIALRLQRGGATVAVDVAPWSAAQWAVLRQAGLEFEEVPFAQAPQAIQDAATALHRAFTGDAAAVPTEFPEQVLRVRAVHQRLLGAPLEVQPGDLLLAAELSQEGAADVLRRLGAVADVQALFNDRARGSYEGTAFRCWFARGATARAVAVTARRLLP